MMSLLMSDEFVICTFCDMQMFDILLCTRTLPRGNRCASIVCFDCRLCNGCLENLHYYLKELKIMKHQAERKDERDEIYKKIERRIWFQL